MNDVIALIPAAGKSTRMGSEMPKVLMPLNGKTMLEVTLDTMSSCALISKIIVLISKDNLSKFAAIRDKYSNLEIVEGGSSRQGSVFNGLKHIKSNTEDLENTYVLVHDAARCFVSQVIVQSAIQAAFEKQAVTVAIPMVDTVKEVEERTVKSSLDREKLWNIQTPQVFKFNLLYQSHIGTKKAATDDASLVQENYPVSIVEGSRKNFKVTTPEDFSLAELLCRGL